MAKETKQTTDWTKANDMSVASMASLNGSLVETMSETFQGYVNGLSAVHQEMTDFISGRLRRDAAFGHIFCSCKTWTEAASLQQEWAQQAAQDYLEETQRLTELGQKVMQENSQTLAERTRPLATRNGSQAPSE
ncbi:MAG: phasin family protein [Alphaproteobacteria bacterium]|nr:phasin family protein [Alphaproteobacteria bacterium]